MKELHTPQEESRDEEDKESSKAKKQSKMVISRVFETSSRTSIQKILKSALGITREDVAALQKNLDKFLNVSVLNSEGADSSPYLAAVYNSISNLDKNKMQTKVLIDRTGILSKAMKTAREAVEGSGKRKVNNAASTTGQLSVAGLSSCFESAFDLASTTHLTTVKHMFHNAQFAEKHLLKTQMALFEAKTSREKLAILAKYAEDVETHINTLVELEDPTEVETITKLESLRAKKKGVYGKLTEVIANTATLNAKLVCGAEEEGDKKLIKKLFDTGVNVKAVPISTKFTETVKKVYDQIHVDALLLESAETFRTLLDSKKIDILIGGAQKTLFWSLLKEAINLSSYASKENTIGDFRPYALGLKCAEAASTMGGEIMKYKAKLQGLEEKIRDSTDASIAKTFEFLRAYIDLINNRAEIERLYESMQSTDALADLKNADDLYNAHYAFYDKTLEFFSSRDKLVKCYFEVLERVGLVDLQLE